MMSAIALTSAVSFTGCASDDSASVDTNPTYDGTSVRTDFAFNITKASQGTRMTDVVVQEGKPFRGMEKMFLLPFNAQPGTATSGSLSGTTTNAACFDLGKLSANIISASASSKVYSITIPVGTNNFLFYGIADRGSDTNYKVGAVDHSLSASTSSIDGIHFDLENIGNLNIDADGTTTTNDAKHLANYLSQVAQSKATLTGTLGEKSWAWTTEEAATNGNFKALALLYTKFTSIGASEARSGSAESVKRMMLDLYKGARAINNENSNEDVKLMSAAICSSITTATSDGVKVKFYKPGGETPIELDYKLDGTSADGDPEAWTVSLVGLTGTSVYNPSTGKLANDIFPANLGLPMGAAQLSYNSGTKKFSYNESAIAGDPSTSSQISVNVTNIDYPAELLYFDNSPLITSDKYKEAKNFPVTTEKWDANKGTVEGGFDSDWTKNSSVAATTRAVAMQNNVNYGVALFKTNVILNGANLTDNMAAIVGGTATDQNDILGSQFKVTGILIGGQPKKIGWDMTRFTGTPASAFDQVIYDRDAQYHTGEPAYVLNTSTASPNNYTIVFDNYDNDGTQEPVLFALEIVNGTKDFYGKDGMIPAGSTFYLVGKLTPDATAWTSKVTAANTARGNNAANYRITEEGKARIFVQDYTTTANITIDATKALKNAYSTIPDLRSTETVFGLSVDLNWTPGLTFDVLLE